MMKAAAIFLALAVVGFGGVAADEGSSFVVEVRRSYFAFSTHLCNGALIDPQWILIPASCVSGFSFLGSLQVIVGTETFSTASIVPHENFDNLHHNIALVRLSEKATFRETGARPIRIPPTNALHTGAVTLITKNQSGVIDYSSVNIVDNLECSHAPGGIWEAQLCAGDGINSLAQSDVGSPIVTNNGESLVGLLIYTKSPAPAVYTRVSSYSTWILLKQIVGSE